MRPKDAIHYIHGLIDICALHLDRPVSSAKSYTKIINPVRRTERNLTHSGREKWV